jgi:hypothetical protein
MCVTLLLLPWASAAATPVLDPLYSVGDLGLIEMTVTEGQVVGRVRAAANCPFALNAAIITGQFEGNVFVGTVELCQSGPQCAPSQTYPFLAVATAESLAGMVSLSPGCRSPGLINQRLLFRPATADEKRRVLGEGSDGDGANGQGKADRLVAQAAQWVLEGNNFLQEQKYSQAHERFRQAMKADASRWEAFLGYAITEMKLGNPQRSLEFFDQTLAIARAAQASNDKLSNIYYNRACALTALGDVQGALSALRLAVSMGGSNVAADILSDTDFSSLRTNADFKRLTAEPTLQSKKKLR